MKVYITLMLSLTILRWLPKLSDELTEWSDGYIKGTKPIATLFCIGMEILAIVFLWKL